MCYNKMIFVCSESFTKQLWGMNSQPEVRETVSLGGDETAVSLSEGQEGGGGNSGAKISSES